MHPITLHERRGYRLAHEGITDLLSEARSYVTSERQSLQSATEPEIAVMRARQKFLLATRRELLHDVAAHRHQDHGHHGRGRGLWSLLIAVCLVLGAFLFSVKTIEAFGLGWMGYVYCIALAVALPYSLDKFMQDFPQRRLTQVVVAATLVTSLGTALLFGMLRGNVLARSLDAEPAVVIDGVGNAGPSTGDSDTDKLVAELRTVWGLAALAFELTAGLAIHDFRRARRGYDAGTLRRLQKELLKVENELLGVVRRLHQLLVQPGQLEAEFWAGFEKGSNDGKNRRSATRRFVSLLLGVLLASHVVFAQDRLDLVVALDLSQSQDVVGLNGKSEFGENVRAISALLGSVPVGTHVFILGITETSYATPFLLLDARTAFDPGAFSKRILTARRALVSAWAERSKSLKPLLNKTDLLGLFRYAGDALGRSTADRKVLVVFSDGRNFTKELDLETPMLIDTAGSMALVKKQQLFARLDGIEIFFLGIGDHSGKRGTSYAAGLGAFWTEFIRQSGGSLKVFSTTRDTEALGNVVRIGAAGK